nr:FMN reductase [Naasia lichenicola]
MAASTPMRTKRTVAVVSAGLSQPSSTRLLADRLVQATERHLVERGFEVEIVTVELREIAKDVTNNLLTGFPSPSLSTVIEQVTGADALIAVTPTFTTSYSGLFKSFMDILDPSSLVEMPVLIGATGGSPRHSLVLDYAMRPLFTYLHALVAPTGVYAASEDWGSNPDDVKPLPERIDRAGAEFAAFVERSDRAGRLVDPFAIPVSDGAGVGGFQAQ